LATRRGLLAAGVRADVIDNDLKAGRYETVYRGVYALGPLSMRGRLVAALLAGGPEAALSHASALVVHQLLASVVTVDLTAPANRRGDTTLRFHRLSLDDSEVTKRHGLRVTTTERTLLDIAATGADIRRLAHEAIAKRLTTQSKLKAMAENHTGERGAPALRRVAGEPHTRSRLERRFLRFLDANGLPRPLTNHPIGPYTVDFFFPQAKLVIETDEDAHKSEWAFEADRARDRFLTGEQLRVMRITAASLQDETVLGEEVRRAARIVR
jgi:very-short-patch-repair endonuclease